MKVNSRIAKAVDAATDCVTDKIEMVTRRVPNLPRGVTRTVGAYDFDPPYELPSTSELDPALVSIESAHVASGGESLDDIVRDVLLADAIRGEELDGQDVADATTCTAGDGRGPRPPILAASGVSDDGEGGKGGVSRRRLPISALSGPAKMTLVILTTLCIAGAAVSCLQKPSPYLRVARCNIA